MLLAVGAGTAGASGANDDHDGDGVRGAADLCPKQPGIAPDGCPPRDSDGDQLTDDKDRCPRLPGPLANRGCPDKDRDRDSVADRVDRCPQRFGLAKFAGCPAPDGDGDGIPDSRDRCKTRAEVWNGSRDWDGCPDRPKALLLLDARTIRFARRITFDRAGRALSRAGAFYMRLAGPLLRRLAPGRVEVVVVAEYGLSYGYSLQRARRRAAAIVAALKNAVPEHTVLIPRPLPPDGRRRVELRYR